MKTVPPYPTPPDTGPLLPRSDAVLKARGKEIYAADFYAAGILWAGVKRAGVAHARIGSIRTGAARRLPGVIAVLTHRDVEGTNRQGIVRKDQPVLTDDKVRHPGDAVALVVAETREALEGAWAESPWRWISCRAFSMWSRPSGRTARKFMKTMMAATFCSAAGWSPVPERRP